MEKTYVIEINGEPVHTLKIDVPRGKRVTNVRLEVTDAAQGKVQVLWDLEDEE